MRNNDEFAKQIADALQIAFAERKVDLDEDGDTLVEEVSAYEEHYMSRDRGVFIRLRLGSGSAEVGIRVQALTDPMFEQELEDIELDNQDEIDAAQAAFESKHPEL